MAKSFAAGDAAAVFVVYLSLLANPRYPACQYAFLSGFAFLLPRLIGGAAGAIQKQIGYDGFFILSGALSFAAIFFLPIVMLKLGRAVHDRFEAVQAHFGSLTTLVQENLSGVRIVRAYRQEAAERARFDASSAEYVRRNMRLARLYGVMSPSLTTLAGLGAAAVLGIGGAQVIAGRMSVGAFVAFGLYLSNLTWPLIALGWVTNLFQRLAWNGVEQRKAQIDPANRYGGLPHQNRDEYKRRSPIYQIDNVEIPLLVHITRNDADVVFEEAAQLVDALRAWPAANTRQRGAAQPSRTAATARTTLGVADDDQSAGVGSCCTANSAVNCHSSVSLVGSSKSKFGKTAGRSRALFAADQNQPVKCVSTASE